MTEEEAKKKRCCGPSGCGRHMEVVDTPDLQREHAEYASHLESFCIASVCMAWRWSGWSKDESGHDVLPLQGYCVLAGKDCI